MLRSENRLRHPRDFRGVYETGRTLTAPSLVVRFRRREPSETVRVGIVVSTKLSKKATIRNRLRRHIREAARHAIIPALNAVDLVIIPRSSARKQTYVELLAECTLLARRLTRS